MRVILVLVLAILCACGKGTDELVVESRVPSPDGKVDALLVRHDIGGATVPTINAVFIVPSGNMPIEKTEIMRGDKFAGLTVKWSQERLLHISYDSGRVFSFRSFWQNKEVNNFEYIVEIQLSRSTHSLRP
jgi:hypothetical protein